MKPAVSRLDIIGALLKKELTAYSRNKLYLFLTLLTFALIVAMFWLMVPDTVDETITLAVSPPVETILAEGREALLAMGASEEQLAELTEANLAEAQEGVRLLEFETEAALVEAVEAQDDVSIGIVFPETFLRDIATGAGDVPVTVYSAAAVPGELQRAVKSFVREAAYQIAGKPLPITLPPTETIVLGEDRVGDQISMRARIVPMLAFMILLMDTFSVASLISVEVIRRTVTAVLVTPAKLADVLIAKATFGTGLAFVQGAIILGLIGAFTAENWWLLALALLVGAMMFTGVAMIAGAAGKDFFGQMFYTMALTVPLLVPAFSVLFPGTAALWVKAIPTYPVISALADITIHEAGWADVRGSFALGIGWAAVLFMAGWGILARKVRSL